MIKNRRITLIKYFQLNYQRNNPKICFENRYAILVVFFINNSH